ncbi:MAG: phosphatase PAP2 family protein [Oscillospiraceae bacterium]|nr:phosphatase PAP2 family protein [Oscillospiraceae bacterium]
MQKLSPERDYRKFRFCRLNTPEFSHLKYLFFWPVFGFMFLFVERIYRVDYYYPMHCALDDKIPFCEYFLIPYLFWFVFLIGIHLYTLLYDVESFKRLMKYIIFTYSFAIIVYLVFPTSQELRPAVFERSNLFTEFLKGFYVFDTNTNVCPSIHVIGSLAVMFTAWHTKGLESPKWKFAFGIMAVLICASTVFLKQHSILDVFAALPICAAAYYLVFVRGKAKTAAE